MPIYEYQCQQCGKRSTLFTKSIGQPLEPQCLQCGSKAMQRALSSFAYHRSTADIHTASGSPPRFPSLDYYKDPRNIGRHVEESFQRFGMEIPGSVKEDIQAAREGEVPKGVQP